MEILHVLHCPALDRRVLHVLFCRRVLESTALLFSKTVFFFGQDWRIACASQVQVKAVWLHIIAGALRWLLVGSWIFTQVLSVWSQGLTLPPASTGQCHDATLCLWPFHLRLRCAKNYFPHGEGRAIIVRPTSNLPPSVEFGWQRCQDTCVGGLT